MWKLALLCAISGTLFLTPKVNTCNEAVCGSIVSKCLLTQSCKCELKNCTCCKECFNCLSYLYDECCSCVDLCPQPHEIDETLLSKKSHVEDFKEPVPGLFDALTQVPDAQNRWNITRMPINIDLSHYGPKGHVKVVMQSGDQPGLLPIESHNIITLNCTVVFMKGCRTWHKCRSNCESMGSNSYRWFHDGCCECIGQHCINYGINESKCRECSMNQDEEEDDDDDEGDYGQDSDNALNL
ncbi:twisted gastrulation protein homolog 1-B-like [Zophobas morio]|uniref:twisted gastrulation protein homolog 1-B-like n=1 Tax=Zophobas morio TaxID=2755281 RepID=UPI003083AC7C